ncbi:MAG: transcriptional repressor [Dialister invisus]
MTEQRKKLFEFFQSHPDMTISARDLAAQLVAEEHAKISVSAVYRNLPCWSGKALFSARRARTSGKMCTAMSHRKPVMTNFTSPA